MGTGLPSRRRRGPATLCCGSETASASALHRRLGMHIIATSFDLWNTEQLLLVYQRYYGKLDAQARRRIVDTARLNGWDHLARRRRASRRLTAARTGRVDGTRRAR